MVYRTRRKYMASDKAELCERFAHWDASPRRGSFPISLSLLMPALRPIPAVLKIHSNVSSGSYRKYSRKTMYVRFWLNSVILMQSNERPLWVDTSRSSVSYKRPLSEVGDLTPSF